MTAAPFTPAQIGRLYNNMPLEFKQEFSNFATFYAVLQWFEGVHNICAVPAALPSPAWCASVDAELADTAAEDARPAAPELLAAARSVVAMTYNEAHDADRRMSPKLYCQCDVLNPCWDNRPDDVPGKHWGGGAACSHCNLRAAIANSTPELPAFAQELAAFGALLDGDSLEQGDAS